MEIDWSNWVNDPQFQKETVPKQVEINEAIVNKHLDSFLNHRSG